MLCLNIMLIEPDTNVSRIDFHKFREWIQSTTANRNSSPHSRIIFRQFFSSCLAGRVDARSRLVDHEVLCFEIRQFIGQNLSDELLGFPTGRTVADRHDGYFMLANLFNQSLTRLLHPLGGTNHVNQSVGEHVAELIHRHQFAAASKAGINRQHTMVMQGWLQQQFTKIVSKHLDRMHFRTICQLTTNLTINTGHNQTSEGIM